MLLYYDMMPWLLIFNADNVDIDDVYDDDDDYDDDDYEVRLW